MTAEEFRMQAAIALMVKYSADGRMKPETAAQVAVQEARVLSDAFFAEETAFIQRQ